MNTAVRYDWQVPFRAVEGWVADRREWLGAGGDLWAPWAPADADARLAGLPQRLATLDWPIEAEGIEALAEDFGPLLPASSDPYPKADRSAAAVTDMRLAILEFQIALQLRDALQRRRTLDSCLPTGGMRERDGWWRLELVPPAGVEGCFPLAAGPFRNEQKPRHRHYVPLPKKAANDRPGERDSARAILGRIFEAAFDRWVRIVPGDGTDAAIAVSLRCPMGAAWYELAQAPELLRCLRCGRVFPRNRRLRQGRPEFCRPSCQRYTHRKSPEVLALRRRKAWGAKRIARELELEERLVRGILARAEKPARKRRK